MNIKFGYLYRDGANYKKFYEVVFSNPNQTSIDGIKESIARNLIEGQWFVAKEWGLPDLHFKDYSWDSSMDHDWHEFEYVKETLDPITDTRTIEKFLLLVK